MFLGRQVFHPYRQSRADQDLRSEKFHATARVSDFFGALVLF